MVNSTKENIPNPIIAFYGHPASQKKWNNNWSKSQIYPKSIPIKTMAEKQKNLASENYDAKQMKKENNNFFK